MMLDRAACRWLVAIALTGWMAGASASEGGDAERGRALYEGRAPLTATTTGGAAVPAGSAGCVKCHRRSGMGSFEGRIAIAPITGRYLFRDLDPDTAKFFPWASRDRVRPAYDAASLGQMLRTGIAPDGHAMRAPMPIYSLSDTELRDLEAYLRELSTGATPGIDDARVRVATITTPGADPARVDALLKVLHAFEVSRNGQTRHETRRSTQATKNHFLLKDIKFRLWEIAHWALEGEPQTWAAQLERLYAREPVFAVLSGVGSGDWWPVEAFCEARRVPCILPLVEDVPEHAAGTDRFYSLYFHGGRDQDLAVAAAALRNAGVTRVELWADGDAVALQRASRQLESAGLGRTERARGSDEAVLSLLPTEAHTARWRAQRREVALAWLPGARLLSQAQWREGTMGAAPAWLVTPMRPAEEAEPLMRRARAWLRAQGLQDLPADAASASLFAATVFGESFSRMDFDYTREYMLEMLEHGLENMIPMTPYARLSIGPEQRVGSKGSYLGTFRGGEIEWRWHPEPSLMTGSTAMQAMIKHKGVP